jgi:hypothetical protein
VTSDRGADAVTAFTKYDAQNIPVDESLLAPIGLMIWAAIRLQHEVRDTLGIQMGAGLSDAPFSSTLGGAIGLLEKAANSAGEPRRSAIADWARVYGRPAATLRDRITHAIAYTELDGTQALKTSPNAKHPAPQRITKELLEEAAGRLARASIRLGEIRNSNQSVDELGGGFTQNHD